MPSLSSIIFHFIRVKLLRIVCRDMFTNCWLITIKHTIHRLCVILILFRRECFSRLVSFFLSVYSLFLLSLPFCVFLSSSIIVVLIFQATFFSCVRVMLIKRSQKLFKFYARYGILLLLFSSECSMHKQFISGRFSFGSLAYVSILFSFSL